MNDTQRIINQVLSLRQPQKDSLDILVQVLEKIALAKNMDTTEALRLIQEVCPSVKDFERAFPCICFAIATGVGKTRLMGAMIAYLHAECKIKNFMVLAPNLTIYNKLKQILRQTHQNMFFLGLMLMLVYRKLLPVMITTKSVVCLTILTMTACVLIFLTFLRLIPIKMPEVCREFVVWLNI